MLRFLIIERPTTATLRPHASEASMTPCRRWMCDEKLVTITRPGASRMMRLSAAATSCSDCVMPGRSAFVESASIRSTPSEPSRASLARSVGPAVDGRVVDLVVARVQDRAVVGVQRDRDGIGHRVRDARELGSERSAGDRVALAVDLDELGVAQQPVLVQLRLDHAERQPRAPDLAHADLAHHVGQRADVVLVAVREDDRVDAAGRVAQVGEVGQDEVDARHLVAREREAAVDQDAALALLDDAQVVADLAQAPERDDAYDVAHAAAVRPLAARAERSTAHCSSVASTRGSRGAPARSPRSSSAALSGMGFVVMESAS